MKSHSGTKNAVCDECGKRFIQWGDLRKHKRIHTGERPFNCSDCGRTFARKDYLTKHLRTHSSPKLGRAVRTAERVTVTAVSRPSAVEDSLVIDVSELHGLVGEEGGEQIQVVRILESGELEPDHTGLDMADHTQIKSSDNVMYVITS